MKAIVYRGRRPHVAAVGIVLCLSGCIVGAERPDAGALDLAGEPDVCAGIGCPCAGDADCATGGCASDHSCRARCADAASCGSGGRCCGGFCYSGACVDTLAGSGLAGAPDKALNDARVNGVYAMVDDGDHLFFTEWVSAGVRVVNNGADAVGPVAPGTVGRLIGGGYGCRAGPVATAAMQSPVGLERDASGNIYAADYLCAVIWKISSDYATVTALAGKPGEHGLEDGAGDAARLDHPRGLTLGPDNRIYFTEYTRGVIRRVSLSGVVETVAGVADGGDELDGPAAAAKFDYPIAAAMDATGTLFVGDWVSGAVRKIDGLASGGDAQVSTIIATTQDTDPDPRRRWIPQYGYAGYGLSASPGQVDITFWNNGVYRLTPVFMHTEWSAQQLLSANGVIAIRPAVEPNQLWLGGWVNSSDGYNHQLVKHDLSTGGVVQKIGEAGVTSVADGAARDATFSFSSCDGALTADDAGNVWVSDRCVNRVRKITPDGAVSSFGTGVFAAAGGTAATASFCYPSAIIAVDSDVYVINQACGQEISKIDEEGTVTIVGSTCVTGEPACPQASVPSGIAIDGGGNLYLTTSYEPGASAKYGNSYWDGMPMIVKVPPGAGGEIGAGAGVFFAGTPNNPYDEDDRDTCRDGPPGEGQFGVYPAGLAIDSADYLYVGDTCGVRKVGLDGAIATLPNGFVVTGVAIGQDPAGAETLFVTRGNEIWTVDRETGAAAWYAGDKTFGYERTHLDGPLDVAKLWGPSALDVGGDGRLYVLDRFNDRIRVINPQE